MRRLVMGLAGGVAAAFVVAAVSAEELRIGVSTETSSLDPHFHTTLVNAQVERHMFDHLVFGDHLLKMQPELAVSWKPVDDLTWEINLRKGVKWHDGNPFTADEVIFTFGRAGEVPNSPGSYRMYTHGKEVIKVDDYTIRIKQAKPNPLLAFELERVAIVSRKHGQGATTQDYNDGKVNVGTGPFKLVEWVKGDRLVLAANPNYWRGRPVWDRVIVKPISSHPARVAALLAGDVHIIDKVPTVDLPKLKAHPDVTLWQVASSRLIYMDTDTSRDISPFVKTNDGEPMFPNPLRDWRVRKAISKAIDRNAIRDRVMDGQAVPTGNIVPEGYTAYVPELKVEPYDPEGAKKLLTQAGYPDGFRITFHGPNDRYINDAKIVEAVAQMLTRVGIKTEVHTQPRTIYFSEAAKVKYSMVLFGYSMGTGGPESPMTGMFQSRNVEAGAGEYNYGRYSNIRVDEIARTALSTFDAAKREELMREATRILVNDLAKIPLHHETNTWATRKGIVYQARGDEQTLATAVSKAK